MEAGVGEAEAGGDVEAAGAVGGPEGEFFGGEGQEEVAEGFAPGEAEAEAGAGFFAGKAGDEVGHVFVAFFAGDGRDPDDVVVFGGRKGGVVGAAGAQQVAGGADGAGGEVDVGAVVGVQAGEEDVAQGVAELLFGFDDVKSPVLDFASGTCLGIMVGMLAMGIFITDKNFNKISQWKQAKLHRK